jgi:predicted permease
MRAIWARLRALFRRDVVAGEIREELDFHVRMRAEDYERAGTPNPEALRRARQRFGNVALWQDRGYDIRGGGVMETIIQDVRYGLRLLRRQPGFTLVAVLTLAVGIGVTTAIASVIDAAMLHPLPYSHPEELVNVSFETARADGTGRTAGYGLAVIDVEAIRAMPNPPVAVGMWRNIPGRLRPITDGPEPERLDGLLIDHGYLDLFGIAPIRGRAIQERDTRPGAPAVVMIGYGYWQRRYAGRDDAIGQQLRLDDGSAEIIGVMPRSFFRDVALFRPLTTTGRMTAMRATGATTYGRLRRGVSIAQAERELTAVLGGVAATGPTLLPGWTARLQPLVDRETSGYWTTANILLGAVGLILLIACVNVAGLLLARGATRMHEVAIRASIGAGRWRLIRQLLTESVLLALGGAIVGVLLAWWTLDALVANIPLPVSSNAPATLNWRVLTTSLALAIVTGVLFGLAPALRLSRVRVSGALSRGNRRAGSALSRRGGQWLIGVEVALALVLVTGAGLMIRSFARLVSVDLGFNPDRVVTLQATPTELKSQVFINFYTGLLESIRQMPDVDQAGAINHLPLMGTTSFTSAITDDGRDVDITQRQILPGYFEAMGLAAKAGRLPASADLNGRRIAVVTERAAQHLFPRGSAVGRTISIGKHPSEIIGIVPELRVDGAGGSREYFEVFNRYRPAPEDRPESLVVVVRPKQASAGLMDRLKKAAFGVGPVALVERVRPGSDWLADNVVNPRRRMVLLGLLGGLGLLLTLIGVFGMTAYAVARRTQEIGVRIAFGATARDVIRAMIDDATRPLAIGIVIGLAGSWFATRLISTFLFQTAPTDAPTFAMAAATLAVTALVAVWIPARRAARVDPVKSLRVE